MKFVLEIKLGNDTMSSRADVAKALQMVSKNILAAFYDCETADIRDINGNRVGKWEFKEEDDR